jgi:Caspase domain
VANRHALLIGVPVYDDAEFNESRLADAVRSDIAAMRAALDQSGYVITDCPTPGSGGGGATPNRIKKAIHEACTNVPVGGVLLIYFSGHGVTIDGRDYLVPSDSYRLNGNAAGTGTGPAAPLAVSSLVSAVPDADVLAACRARLVVFFVDACRNDPAPDELDAGGPTEARLSVELGGVQPFLADGGEFVLMMGCGAGQVCQYMETGSVFTETLAKALDPRSPARTLAEVAEAVTADMKRRFRQPDGATQVPVVRNPGMLKLAGDVPICDGDELTDAWRKAVNDSPLLLLVPDRGQVRGTPDKDVVREVVDQCAQRCRAAVAELSSRTGLTDPWTDQDYPGRVLGNAELLLDHAGLLPDRIQSLQAGADPLDGGAGQSPSSKLRAGEAALLIAAPFLREAVLAVGLRDAAGLDPGNLDRTFRPGARNDLELTHEMHQHLVRRAAGLRAGGTAVTGPAGAAAGDRLAMWLVHQWLAGRGTLWDGPGASEVYTLARPLIEGCLGAADEGEAPRLTKALLQAVGAQPTDEWLLTRLTGAHVDDGWRTAAAVLWLAGIMAADPRRLPMVVPDLVGTGMELPLTDVRDAAGRRAKWIWGEDRVLDLALVCRHPALHDAFEDIVARAAAAVKAIGDGLRLPSARANMLPRTFTAGGLRPATRQENELAYDVPLSRFQIAEEKVRELLMGRQLYGDRQLAIRELYQNALDACRWRHTRQQYRQQTDGDGDPTDWAGHIQFRQGADDEGRLFIECEDNGVGMDLNTLKHVFANAGERFVYGQEFRAEQADWAEQNPPLRMVSNSQFGVGVFSYFMLADEITVVTRHQRRDGAVEGQAHEVRIASSGSLFQIRPAPGRLPVGGTRIRLYLSGDARDVSVLTALRDFLWIADYLVTVAAPDGEETWKPRRLWAESAHGQPAVEPLKCGNDLWWVPGKGGLAADGIKTNVEFHGLVVNLCREHRPQFTVDRKTLRTWDQGWVADQVRAGLPDLMAWPGLTLRWLWDMTRSEVQRAQQVFDYATLADQQVRAPQAGAVAPLVSLQAAGCVPTDQAALSQPGDGFNGSPRFKAWRWGVLRHLGYSLGLMNPHETLAYGLRIARLLPERIDGFPVPGPLDGALLDHWVQHRAPHDGDDLDEDTMLSGFAEVGCTPRTGVRRWRRYAITGLDLSAARGLPPIDHAISADDAKLLGALEPWPPTAGTRRPALIGKLVRLAIAEGRSSADLVRRADGVVGWSGWDIDSAEEVQEAVVEADRVMQIAGDKANVWWGYGETGPDRLAAISRQFGMTLGEVLELSDSMAPMGVTVPARDAYPAEIDEVESAALEYIGVPGGPLFPLYLLRVAAEAGVSVGAAHQALARLETRGLLVRPELNGAVDLVPTEREVDLLQEWSSVDTGPNGGTSVRDQLWLRIAEIITRPRGGDEELLRTAKALIPFAAPRRQLTQAELVEATWRLQTTVAEASDALRSVYPDVSLPSVPADCNDLVVPWGLHDALLNLREISWQLRSAEIGLTAWLTRRPLGDILALLDPFRRLGAPVPAYDASVKATLNPVTLDDYDADMLMDLLDEDDADERANAPVGETVTALRLVQVAGRFGWTLAEAHRRFARLVPIGVKLDYPQVEFPDEIVRWEDLLVLTTFFDGRAPVISGTVDQAYLEKAAEEIFDASPEEIPAKADWLRERLTIYIPLFSLELDSPSEVVVD